LVEQILLGLGLALLGYVAWVLLDSAYVYSRFEGELADFKLASVHDPSAGSPLPSLPRSLVAVDSVHLALGHRVSMPDSHGFLGVLEVPRLGFSTVILEGIDRKTLRRAVGHIPGTAFPGANGNVGIAGHRDRFFRPLKDIRPDDLILVQTPHAFYTYCVDSLRVVSPDDTEILDSSRAGQLTLITCHPFFYVGPSPERFVVFARQVENPLPL
jgi:sortase A